MIKKIIPPQKLDQFGPYGSAIGSLIGLVLYFIFVEYLYLGAFIQLVLFLLFFLAGPILAVYLNTCIHNKNFISSKSGIYGGVGAFVGQIFGFIVAFPVNLFVSYWGFVIIAPFPIILSFLFARISCEHAKKRLAEISLLLKQDNVR